MKILSRQWWNYLSYRKALSVGEIKVWNNRLYSQYDELDSKLTSNCLLGDKLAKEYKSEILKALKLDINPSMIAFFNHYGPIEKHDDTGLLELDEEIDNKFLFYVHRAEPNCIFKYYDPKGRYKETEIKGNFRIQFNGFKEHSLECKSTCKWQGLVFIQRRNHGSN